MSTFVLYRYQFAPIKDREPSLSGNMNVDLSDEELMDKKQDIFSDILKIEKSDYFRNSRKRRFGHLLIYNQGGISVFRLANTRKTRLESHFVKQEITYTPSSIVIVDNRKDCQFIAIEKSGAFEDTDTVSKILQHTFGEILRNEGLHINIQKMYATKDFWNVVTANSGKINKIRFIFSYPNLPTLNTNVKEMIKIMSKSNKCSTSALEFEAESGKALEILQTDKDMVNLAETGADSGDEIKVRLNGSKSMISVGKTERTIELNDIVTVLSGNLFQKGYEKVCEIFNKLLR